MSEFKQFSTDREIADLCPPEMVLPNTQEVLEFAVPSATGNVSPVELSWIIYNKELSEYSGLSFLRDSLLVAKTMGRIDRLHEEIVGCSYGNHSLRVIARVALDPRRFETFDFAATYDIDWGKRLTAVGERRYFEQYHLNYGLVERNL
jgi:hypothetical protein